MAHSVAKAGPYYSSGQISFSSLRTNFRAAQPRDAYSGSESSLTDNNPIKVSDLLRTVDENNTDPIVPNATENSNITTSSNWKTSQFRNSIKFYYIQHSGTDTNVDIDSQSWNSNLPLNVRKIYFVDGTQGSNSPGSPASTVNSKSINLTIDVSGSIFGASGKGGGTSGAPSISGGTGGDALNADLGSSSKNVVIKLRNGEKYTLAVEEVRRGKQDLMAAAKSVKIDTQLPIAAVAQDVPVDIQMMVDVGRVVHVAEEQYVTGGEIVGKKMIVGTDIKTVEELLPSLEELVVRVEMEDLDVDMTIKEDHWVV